MNTRDSLSQKVVFSLNAEDPNKNIFVHKDSTVDIAVIPWFPNQEEFDFKIIPEDYFKNKSDFNNITEGTEVFFTGMFTPYLGDRRMYPIVRFGRVALVTDEKIQWDNNEKTKLYLIESASYGGNSGSPVFYYLGASRGDGNLYAGSPVIKLMGIMKGFFNNITPIQVINTQSIPVSISNVGIAAVTPSFYLNEILFSKEMVSLRGF